MLPLLEKLLWSSPVGKTIRNDAVKAAEAQRADLQRQIAQHEKARDQEVTRLAAEQAELEPQLEEIRQHQKELTDQVQQLHHRTNVQLPGEMETCRRECCAKTIALRDQLREVNEALTQIQGHA